MSIITDTSPWTLDWIVKAALGGFVGILAWLLKQKSEKLDKHVEACNERHVAYGQLETRTVAIEQEIRDARKQVTWIGDCVMRVGTKLDVDLPERP